MVEVEDVALEDVGAEDEVADDAAVVGDLVGDAEGRVEGERRGRGVRRGADAADPLGHALRVHGMAAAEEDLEAAEHRAGAPRLLDLAAVHHHLHPQVAFDAVDGVDDDGSHARGLLPGGVTSS